MRLRKHLEDIISDRNEYVAGNATLFQSLRFLNLPDKGVMDRYWDKVEKEIKADHSNSSVPKNYLDTVILNYCNVDKYAFGGSYRHYGIEKTLKDIIIKDLRGGMSNIVPSKFARYASFIVGYSKPMKKDDDIPNFVVDKIEKMSKQFKVHSTMHLSRGLHIYSNFKNRSVLKSRTEGIVSIINHVFIIIT